MGAGEAQDTIAAIATAPGEAGIAIVRVSGPRAFAIADELFAGPRPPPSQRAGGTFVHGCVREGAAVVDEVLLLIMRAPHSYTGEDAVEFQGHGGSVPAARILRRALAAGARSAEPGEFTRRAFLNGRIDLTQAEAVLDLIRARSDRAAGAALEQLAGRLGQQVNEVYDGLLRTAADLEASLDFPEDELPATVLPALVRRLHESQSAVDKLLGNQREGHLLREGAKVAIVGRPNAGKSTLLNALLGRDRAIVSHHPGTTRDTIEELLILKGLPVRLVDTAGLRDTDSELEKIGIQRAVNELQNSDACIYLVDAAAPPHSDDMRRLRELADVPCLLVLNKQDLGDCWREVEIGRPCVRASLLKGEGLDAIKEGLHGLLLSEVAWSATPHASVSERHGALLAVARALIVRSAGLLSEGDAQVESAASLLREALQAVGQITGRVYERELLDSIFSRFCIGK